MDTETTHGTSQEHHGVGHIVPVRTLFATATLLLILTVVTVAVAKIDFGNFNIWSGWSGRSSTTTALAGPGF